MSSSSARVFGRTCRVLMAAAKNHAADPTAVPAATAAATKTATKAPQATAKKNLGISQPVPVSPALGKFLGGASEASRTGVVKKVWEHIKLNNLQNPTNKRVIFCDEKLKTLFDGKDEVGFLEIAKLLSPHFGKAK